MLEHLHRLLLTPQLNQGRNRIQRIEQEMRLHLHLQCAELRLRKLLLQFERLHRIALRAHLELHHSDDAQHKPVDQNLDAETVEIEQTGPYLVRRGMGAPFSIDEPGSAENQKVREPQGTADHQMNSE